MATAAISRVTARRQAQQSLESQVKSLFRTETYADTHTIDGVTVPITRTRQVPVLQKPTDWDAIAVRGVFGLVLALTLISVIWSTTSISNLLGATWVSYLAASLFDLSWLAALGLAFIARHRPDRRRIADRLSWALLAITVTALFLEGMRSHSLALAGVGATVSIAAKLLWWVSSKVTEPELTDADRQWIEVTLSQASAKLAVASARRQVQRVEDNAVAQLLALEAERNLTPTTTVEDSPVDSVEDTEDSRSDRTLTDSIRVLVRLGVRDKDTLTGAVREMHGESVEAKTVARLLHRVNQEIAP